MICCLSSMTTPKRKVIVSMDRATTQDRYHPPQPGGFSHPLCPMLQFTISFMRARVETPSWLFFLRPPHFQSILNRSTRYSEAQDSHPLTQAGHSLSPNLCSFRLLQSGVSVLFQITCILYCPQKFLETELAGPCPRISAFISLGSATGYLFIHQQGQL